MRFICNNLAVLHVAIVVSVISWMFGGTQGAPLVSVLPWLFVLTMEVLFVFPQKEPGESTYEARTRVWKALKRDPLTWVSLALLVLLAIPFVNNGLCPSCDRLLIAEGHRAEPPVPFLPFCVNRLHHLNVFLWFATALPCALVTRHAITHHGKRLLLELIVWNGFALAILGFVQTVCDAPGPLWQPFTNVANPDSPGTFFSTFGYPNMAGDYFTTLFGIAIALWRRADDEVHHLYVTDRNAYEKDKRKLAYKRYRNLIPATVFFFAAVNTLSRASMMLVVSLTALYFLHAFLSFARRMTRPERIKRGTIALAITGFVVFCAISSIPDAMQTEINTLDTKAVLTRVTGKGQYHVRVATAIWRDNLLFGCGGWGYKHFCIPQMTADELKQIQMTGGINVHNDYLQFLCEHGLVGFALMVAAVLLLLKPVFAAWRRLYRDIRFVRASQLPAKPVLLFILPAPVFCLLMTVVATFIHGFGDCPLRSAAVLVLFFVVLSSMTGFLPRHVLESQEEESNHASRQ